jgi:crossover junction endodeoxyribonuclease RuvC
MLPWPPVVAAGIDPGTRSMGFGVVGRVSGGFARVDHGAFRPSPGMSHPERLRFLFMRVKALLDHHRPDVLALEQTFFAKNAQSTLRIGEARAIVFVASAECGVPVVEYAPRTVKRSVTGHGGADKVQVQEMVARELNLDALPSPHDAADALALALCVLYDPALDPRFSEASRGFPAPLKPISRPGRKVPTSGPSSGPEGDRNEDSSLGVHRARNPGRLRVQQQQQ